MHEGLCDVFRLVKIENDLSPTFELRKNGRQAKFARVVLVLCELSRAGLIAIICLLM